MRSLKRVYAHIFIGLLLASSIGANAQTLSPGVILAPISSATSFTNGVNITQPNQLSYNALISLLLQLKVKASGAFTNPNGYSIPLSALQISNTSVTGAVSVALNNILTTLSNLDQVLANGINVSALTNLLFSLNYNITGGSNLLVPAGTYTTNITFTLTQLGILTTTVTEPISIVVSDLSSLSLGGGATSATLPFAAITDYNGGVQLPQLNAFTVFSNKPYAVSVRAVQNLTNGANTIPVSDITLTPASVISSPSTTLHTVALSTTTQNIISAAAPTLLEIFNLQYSAAGNNADFINKPSGLYGSTLVYTITQP